VGGVPAARSHDDASDKAVLSAKGGERRGRETVLPGLRLQGPTMKWFWTFLLLGAAASQTLAQDVILVTGDRTGERREATALPITLLSIRDIEQTGAHHPAELINRVPGAFINRGNGAEHLTAIRSPVLTGGAGAGSFLYLEDGIPLRAAGFANVNGLFEALTGLVGGVEVVRGPGPALYGSNALHGLINVRTPDPATTPRRLTLEAGSFERQRTQAIWTGQHGDTGWLAGWTGQHEGGWRDESGLDRSEILVRAGAENGALDWRFTLAGISLEQETAGYVRQYRDPVIARANPDPEGFRDAHAVRAALQVGVPLGQHWRATLTPYARINAMKFRMHFLPSEALEESGHASLGLQSALVRDLVDTRLTLGLDFEHTRGALSEFQERPTLFSFVQGDHYDYAVTANVAAVYGQVRHALTDRLTIQGGLRLEATGFDYENRLPANTVGRYLRLPDRRDDFIVLTPNVGLTRSLDSQSVVFARLARGSRAPQTAELYRLQRGQAIDDIEPEILDSAELGWRRIFTNDARIELTGYIMRKTNVFFRDADGLNVTDGVTRHHGVEADLDWPLTERLALTASVSWAGHSYGFDREVANASEVIRSGNRVDTAPEWLWTARLDWQTTDRLRTGLEWVHVGEYFTNAANTRSYEGHDLVNLRLRFAANDRVTLFGTIRNLAGTRYAERADFAFGNERYFPGEERAFSLGVTLSR
jgi:iron complex outermembrane recepter protein